MLIGLKDNIICWLGLAPLRRRFSWSTISRGTSKASSIHISDIFCNDSNFVSSSSPKNINCEPLLSVIVLSVLFTLTCCLIWKKSSCSLISCHTVCITVDP